MHSERLSKLEKFLFESKISNFELKALPVDASFRTYYKVVLGDGKVLLVMDCPIEHYSIEPFLAVTEILAKSKVRLAQIHSYDKQNGFILLECFKGGNICDVVTLENQSAIYRVLLDILVTIQKGVTQFNKLPIYDTEKHLAELEIYLDWYVDEKDRAKRTLFLKAWEKVFAALPIISPTFCHLDYHVENLMLVEPIEQFDISNIGVIDFQDARIASPIYDVVSLLEDARRDVSFEFAREMFAYYLNLRPEISLEDASIHYHILGAQRNMRILGVFARKAKRDGDNNYLQYLPRLRKYLAHDLMLPSLAEVRELYGNFERDVDSVN